MKDVAEMLRADLSRVESRRQQMRESMPGTAALVDSLTAVFGPVKVKWASEGGREVGTRQPFDGIDADKLIALDDWSRHARKRGMK